MQLGVFQNFEVLKGDDQLIKYASTSGSVFRNSFQNCGSFCYKVLSDGAKVAPLGALEPKIKPTCHIFVRNVPRAPTARCIPLNFKFSMAIDQISAMYE